MDQSLSFEFEFESYENNSPAGTGMPNISAMKFETIFLCDLDKRDPEFENRRKFFYSTKHIFHSFGNKSQNDPEEPPEIEDEEATANEVPKANFLTGAEFG